MLKQGYLNLLPQEQERVIEAALDELFSSMQKLTTSLE